MPATSPLLHFVPIYQTRVWGGRRFESLLGRALPDAQPYGESWDLVDRAEAQSVVAEGAWAGTSLHDLWMNHRAAAFGACYAAHPGARFPILIKVLDCADELSIQVHPPAALAPALKGEPKTEMWYVAHADANARLYAGVKQGVTREVFADALLAGTVAECVPVLHPREGDSLFVPSGRLHALGRGLLIYEIQQNSDTTYRVFDWNRLGLDGRPRALHVSESMQCIDFNDHDPVMDHDAGELATCEFFRVSRVRTGHAVQGDRFRLIMPITPTLWAKTSLAPGQLTLCPAIARLAAGEPIGEWLEIELPVGEG